MLFKIIAKRFSAQAAPRAITAQLKALPYEIGALEPVISGHLMEFHYGKHHRTYVNNLNIFTEKSAQALAAGDIKSYIELCNLVKFNGGGHLNHEFFWESLAPIANGGGQVPAVGTDLRDMMDREWGSVENFQNVFST
jgi:superoxide dismutase, Fe-Mn family